MHHWHVRLKYMACVETSLCRFERKERLHGCRGRGYEHAIDLPGLGRLTGVFARHRAERGDSVSLRLDPEGCHLFPATAVRQATDGTGSPAPALTV